MKNSSFMIQSPGIDHHSNQRSAIGLLQSANRVCSTAGDYSDSVMMCNVYHWFLRYLYLNLKENAFNSSAGAANTTSYVNTVWRTLKGRLYTRLHDKRFGELDSFGLVNLTSLFFVLIRCFSPTTTSTRSPQLAMSLGQLRKEQLESIFRIFGVNAKAKGFHQKLDVITANVSSSSQLAALNNAIRVFFECKFATLQLWCSSAATTTNEDELADTLKSEFSDVINGWLSSESVVKSVSNPINGYKSSQLLTQLMCECVVNYLLNCNQLLLTKPDGQEDAKIAARQLVHAASKLLCNYSLSL